MPYAAKATIIHEFDTDHIDIYITFAKPMKICSDPINNPTVFDIKPTDDKWIIAIDEVEAEVDASDWLDQYTMHLLIENAAESPSEVLVTYDGPDYLLRTAWDKQWEPWVDILSSDLTANLFQPGMILLWSGSIATIPTGWALCDGTNGTPNLKNKFIVGAGDTYAVTATGGALTHTHTATQAQHYHTLAPTPGVASGTYKGTGTDSKQPAITVVSENHLPPYYALAYIMKL